MLLPAGNECPARIEAALAGGAEFHRLGDGEGWRQSKTLVDQFDAGGAAVIDMARADLAAMYRHGALARLDEAGGDASEGGLAGAVLADDGMDEARREGDRYIGERHDIAIALHDGPTGQRDVGRHTGIVVVGIRIGIGGDCRRVARAIHWQTRSMTRAARQAFAKPAPEPH